MTPLVHVRYGDRQRCGDNMRPSRAANDRKVDPTTCQAHPGSFDLNVLNHWLSRAWANEACDDDDDTLHTSRNSLSSTRQPLLFGFRRTAIVSFWPLIRPVAQIQFLCTGLHDSSRAQHMQRSTLWPMGE